MARPRNADGQRTRRAILDAALDLFAEKGYFGTSLRDVARAVGVRESALYNYFAGKEALFEALLAEQKANRQERMTPLPDAPIADGRALLEQIATDVLDAFSTPREQQFFRIAMSDGIRLAKDGRINLHERMSSGRDRLHDVLRRLIREGWLRPADVQMLSLAFFSPLVMWRQLHAVGADLPMIRAPREFARQHVEQFLLGAGATRTRTARRSPVSSSRAAASRRAAD